jgi:hypothetical protein
MPKFYVRIKDHTTYHNVNAQSIESAKRKIVRWWNGGPNPKIRMKDVHEARR